MSGTLQRRDALAIALLAIGSAWGAGNVGPIVPDLVAQFELSLTTVGLVSGTVFYLGVVIGLAFAPKLAERSGVVGSLRISAALVGIGCLLMAVAPAFVVLGAGRLIAGLGLGAIAAVGPVYGRTVGGVLGAGLFGGSFQMGIAFGVGAGSVIADAGVSWRIGFLVAAVAGFSALAVMKRDDSVQMELKGGGFIHAASRSPAVYRLGLLFIAMFSAPLVLGAWLVHFLSAQSGMSLTVAGVLGFVLFAASGVLRYAGAGLDKRGVPEWVLAGFMPLLATVGIAAIAFDQSVITAFVAVVLIAAGFALPYTVMIIAAQRLWPEEPADPVALLTAFASGLPIIIIPLFGAALSDGNGDVAFLIMAVIVAVAGLLNTKLPQKAIPGSSAAPAPGG